MIMLLYKVLLPILITIETAYTQIDKNICTPAKAPIPPPPPDLTSHYSALVEWKEVITNRTYTVQEFYDADNQRGKMTIRYPFQSDVTVIFNYDSKEIYILKKGACETKQMEFYDYEDKQWLTPLISIYQMIIHTQDAVFSGHTVLRGYPVSHWQTCTFQPTGNITTLLDIYYSDNGWIMPDTPPNRPVPVQIVMHGKHHGVNVTEFHVIGDVIEYTCNEFSSFNEDTFMTPPGVYCPGRINTKGLPVVEEAFSMVMEIIDMDFHHITFQQLWFDGKKQMIRYDTKSVQGNDPDPESTILDFNTGHRYTTDTYTGSCDIQRIRAGDEFVRVDDSKLYMLSSAQYFHLKTDIVQYVGQRRTRGIMCDVWVGVFYDVDAARNMTVEWYFTPNPWMEAVDTLLVTTDFIRMDVWKGTNPTIHNIVKYSPVSQQWSVFDFGNCYVPQSKLHFIIYFEILNKQNFRRVSIEYMKMKLIEELSAKILLEPNRLSNVMFDYDGDTKFFLSATFLDQPPSVNNAMAVHIDTKPLVVAYDFLKGNVASNMMLLLSDTAREPVRLRSERILQISYPAEFATTTTSRTPSTPLRIPTLPHVTNNPNKTPAAPTFNITTTIKTPELKTSPATKLQYRTSAKTTHKHTSQFTATIKTPELKTSPATKLQYRTSAKTTHKHTSQFTATIKTPELKTSPATKLQYRTSAKTTHKHTSQFTATKQRDTTSTTTHKHTSQFTANKQRDTTSTSSSTAKYQTSEITMVMKRNIEHNISKKGEIAGAVIGGLFLGIVLCFVSLVVISRFKYIPWLNSKQEDTEMIPLGNY